MTPTRPLISVLLLCYNEAIHIRRALLSILEQSLEEPVEIILMDDGSVDESCAIVQAQMAQNTRENFTLKVIRSEKNLGNAAAFCAALKAARGEYYHVLDGDDYWIDPDKLKKQAALLAAHPDLSGVAHRTILRSSADDSESFHPQIEPEKTVLSLADFLVGGAYFHTSAMLFRNSFYDPSRDHCEVPAIFNDVRGDTIRLYVHAARGEIYYLAQTMSVYDDHRAGIWTGLDWPGRRKLLGNLYTQLSDHGYLDHMGAMEGAYYLADRLQAISAYAPGALRPLSLYPAEADGAARKRLTEISRIASVLDLEMQLTKLTAAGEYEEALRLAHRFLTALTYDANLSKASASTRISAPEVDWHCAHIGGLIGTARQILPSPASTKPNDQAPVVIVVSGVAQDQDGMWAQTSDMIALWRGKRPVVVISTEFMPSQANCQALVGEDVRLMLNTDEGLVEKTAWLIWHLAQLKPAQILVNPARSDVAILAGLRREHAPRIHLIGSYQTGYFPALRHYALDGYVARRPYDISWYHSHAPGREVVHLPVFTQVPPNAPGPRANLPLVTLTAAQSPRAFGGQYDYGLQLIVPTLLRAGAVRHIHLGPLPEGMENRIHKALISHGFAPDMFAHFPGSGDFAADIAVTGATVFLQSAPRAELGPLLAAIAAGLPVITHKNYLHPALSLADLCPPQSPSWANIEQLFTVIKSLTPEARLAQSQAMAHYFTHRLAGAKPLAEALGAGFMAALSPEQIGPAGSIEPPQELRRLLSQMMEMTLLAPLPRG